MNFKKIVKFSFWILLFLFSGIEDVAAQKEVPASPNPPTTLKVGVPSQTTFPNDKVPASTPADLKGAKVDNMSDAQIRELMQRMGQFGRTTDQQLENAARSRGMSAAEIQKLKDRVAKLKNKNEVNADEKFNEPDIKDKSDSDKSEPRKGTNDINPRIFGSQLFSFGFKSFEPNLQIATPPNYVIGPNDLLLIDLTGDNEAHYKLKVSPEGFITLEYVGRVDVGGLTVDEARQKLKYEMQNTYPSLRTGGSQVALNLNNIRSINVIINGEVAKPGTYTLPSVASVFNALYASGGPNQNGSFRNIQVIRGNNVIAVVDLYDFLINGIQTGNVRLEDQDIIHIPVYKIRIDVLGEVKRSAIYEIGTKESLVDVLRYAGGFSDAAFKNRVRIVQNTSNAQKLIIKELSEFPKYIPKNGDKIFVDSIFNVIENKVEIGGAVTRKGMYEYKIGLTLTELIRQAEGLAADVFMNRGFIIRLNPDNTSSLVSFSVAEVMKGGTSDILLERNDVVQIASIFDLRDEQTVNIIGEVRMPGTFSFNAKMTVADLIQMAGGFKDGANPMSIEVSRRAKQVDLTKQGAVVAEVFRVKADDSLAISQIDFPLIPNDLVLVRMIAGYTGLHQVQILGEVLNPGYYTIKYKNERISNVIERAGGLTAYAYPEGASLKRPSSLKIDSEEEKVRFLNLNRLKQAGTEEFTDNNKLYAGSFSDLVGIELAKILKNPGSRNDLIVEDGDIIRIPAQLQTVKVTGEVLRPISVVYKPGKSFKYYVSSAGGFTKNAFKRGSYISNPNGSVSGTTKLLFFNNYPTVMPGSEISVPQKAKKEGVGLQAWIGISTGLVSLAAMILALLKN